MTMNWSLSPHVTTIEVKPLATSRGRVVLRFLAPYLVAPLAAAALLVLVAFAEAFPTAALVSAVFSAALAGPALDVMRRRRQRAEINDSRYRDERLR